MNALVYPRISSESLSPGREVSDGPTPPWQRNPNTSRRTGAPADIHRLDTVTLHLLVSDSHGAHLENFPFAFILFVILIAGVTTTVWGILLTTTWLTGIGFSITLAGGALYGWSLYDE